MKDPAETEAPGDSSLLELLLETRNLPLDARTRRFAAFLRTTKAARENLYFREIEGPAGREVCVRDPFTGLSRQMLMFGSNNYLDLAADPYVRERVVEAIERFGTGVGGPPMLNGFTSQLRNLEERLAAFKGAEAAIVFPSGYQTNLGLVDALMDRGDLVLYDESHHASIYDGLKLSKAGRRSFPHNDVGALEALLEKRRPDARDAFVCVESVYSMDGDLSPLPAILKACRAHNAHLVVDDAHGTGVLGDTGRGAAEHYGLEGQIDLTMGTFSKALAGVGGFVTGPTRVIDYLRYFARSYMFSAAIPPAALAMVLAALDVLEREPERVARLRANVAYLAQGLRDLGFDVTARSAILPLFVPHGMKIRKAAYAFQQAGIFLNAIEWPAVPPDRQRFRISLMTSHTRDDLDRLLEVIQAVWSDPKLRESGEDPPTSGTRSAASRARRVSRSGGA